MTRQAAASQSQPVFVCGVGSVGGMGGAEKKSLEARGKAKAPTHKDEDLTTFFFCPFSVPSSHSLN
jgi:hypothetical protein